MMDDSSKSALPLVWIIDLLARSQLVPLSVLIDFSSKIPKSYDLVFDNLRELVSLRILESIHALQPTSSISTAVKSIRIDPSQNSCLDVLQRIIKSSGSNLKTAAIVMSKWDIETFLKYKKCFIPKCSLLKIKDAILKGNPPHLASLREQSGLPLRNQPQRRTRAPNMRITQIPSQNDHLIPPVPALRKIVEESTSKHQEGNVIKSVENHKPGKIYNEKQKIPHSLNKSNVETSQKSISANALGYRKGFSASDKIERLRQEPNSDGQGQREHKQTANVNMDELDQDTQINVSNAEELNKSNVETSEKIISANAFGYRKGYSASDKNERLRQEPDSDGQGQHEHKQTANVNMDELDQDTQIKVSNAEEAEKRESCIASDRHNEQMADVAKRKGAFLSSQCTLSQDSLADTFSDSELLLCLKCNKGGNLLVCSNSCALAIHESCMTSGLSFDKDGKFYCPFCAFSRALSEYNKVKAKVSAARNEFSKFISTGSRKKTGKQSTSQNNLNQVDSLPKKTDLKSKAICRGKLYREKAGPSESGLHSKVKEVGSTNGTHCTKSNHKEGKKRTRPVTHSPRVIRQRQTREQVILKSQNEKAVHEISERSDELVEIRSKKRVSGPTETDLHCENKSSTSDESASEEEISEYSSDNSFDPGASEDDVRVIKNPDKQSLLRAQKRRFRWTSEEENKLQEAMKALCDEENTTIPWTKILEYGAGTFHERRTAMHLKDKWRNMCKRANKQ